MGTATDVFDPDTAHRRALRLATYSTPEHTSVLAGRQNTPYTAVHIKRGSVPGTAAMGYGSSRCRTRS
jgi:hypothetical protein